MVAVDIQKKYTVEEYIEFEEFSDIRHEFYYGELFPIENTTLNHNRAKRNFLRVLENTFDPLGCQAFDENVKVEIVRNGRYVYPDILLTCDEDDKKAEYIVRNPVLIVEVLSKSTSDYDKGDKFKLYKKLPSLKHYLLIDSQQIGAELYSRTSTRSIWTYQSFEELNEIIEIPDLSFSISMAEIYQNITF
jgi:Uma2 family endonuclease